MSAMPLLDLDEVAEEDRELVEQIEAALRELPSSRRGTALHKLANVLAYAQRTRDYDRLDHFVRSLLFTARMYRNPDFVRSQEHAEAHPPEPGSGVDVQVVLARLDERRRQRER
jgi:hypothetical protein